MELSVVLITWNSESYVTACLDSLWTATEGVEREILLVDNGSTDATRELLQPYIARKEVRYFPQPKNLGVAKARNIGLREARGKYIWLLDIDTVVNREAFTAMRDYLERDALCGICGCMLKNAAGEVQESCRRYPTFRYKLYNVGESLCGKWRLGRRFNRKNQSQFYHREMASGRPFYVEYIIGANQLIRREVIEQVGYLDERIFYGPEDADFCLRANAAGWRVAYLPEVSFLHAYQRLTDKRLFSRMAWLHTKALLYFFRKHRMF
ncbi:MAG: glycosyltransferase family 2 protein [Porphyromonadaceae bacterium]|nr:glycosyltransferase family 2 protein [Porphyromonadaceae bacterium]